MQYIANGSWQQSHVRYPCTTKKHPLITREKVENVVRQNFSPKESRNELVPSEGFGEDVCSLIGCW